MQNPLLTETLPIFAKVEGGHFESAIDTILERNRKIIIDVLQEKDPTFENTMAKLEDADVQLQNVWGVISHLHSVVNLPLHREPYEKCLQKITAYQIEFGQNKELYQLILKLRNSPSYNDFPTAQKKIIYDQLLDFKLSGIDLPEQQKNEYKEIQQKLSTLSNQFETHVLDATDAWFYLITNEQDLVGIPEHTKQSAFKKAQEKKLKGWLLSLDFPTYFSVISYAENRNIREKIYHGYVTRASDVDVDHPEFDNSKVMNEILELRHNLANLLGYKNFSEVSIAKKMAKSTDEILNFLNNLQEKSYASAKREIADLAHFASERFGISKLEPWDISFVSERYRQEKFSINDEQLRAYFPEKKVLSGLFEIVKNLFGINFVEQKQENLWHKDVKYFELFDENNQKIGAIYLDLYARPQKRSGAWMDSCRVRHRLVSGFLQDPVAYVICNFSPSDKPYGSLLTHEEVQTLFHEFGHALHHLLTKQEISSVSGIHGVPWDGVEFPSQFMENFCWAPQTLSMISQHVETGESLPSTIGNQLIAAKNFQSAMAMLRQLEFSLFDLKIHSDPQHHDPEFIQKILNQIRAQVSVVPIAPYNRFQHSFSHIFAGGYAAGYYSYKWAEVLSADAFERFQEAGVLNATLGREFRDKILAKGGSENFIENFIHFRGRPPVVDALLKQEGIIYNS